MTEMPGRAGTAWAMAPAIAGFGKRGLGRRAQLFSLDLLIAIAVFTFSLGVMLQLNELAAKQLTAMPESNAPETIAEAMAAGQQLDNAPPYCFRYSNGTGNCSGFSCPGDVFAARKITDCAGAPCLLEVRTCG